jgi:UDP-2,3-diacylglucosamine pyrophosphatase LpxH
MMCDVANMAISNGADQLEFILAGDVFDLHRTQLWFGEGEDIRPYVDCNDVKPGSVLETKLLSILDAIVREDAVKDSLEVFHRFSGRQYLDTSDGNRSIKDFEPKTVLRFLPGNHDRLTNATPAIRARVRTILGLEGGDAKFSHQFKFTDPPVLVRHGHEYDPINFSVDLSGKFISNSLPDDLYDKPTFGDFVTVMIASRLPVCFRQRCTDAAILSDTVLAAIYYRILEFDDVRPPPVVLDFFFNMVRPQSLKARFPDKESWQRYIWAVITPVLIQILDEVAQDKYFADWLRKFGKGFWVHLLRLRPWRYTGLPFWFSRLVGVGLSKEGGGEGPQSSAAHETALTSGTTFIVAGHTHKPQVAHLFTDDGDKKYFTDTGTWRNAILTAGDKKSYGRVNATTYVAFYGKERDPSADTSVKAHHGFEFWTGYDQSWPINGIDG